MTGCCGTVADAPAFEVWKGSELQLEFEGRQFEGGLPLDFTGATATCVLTNRIEDPEELAVLKVTTENGGIDNTEPATGKLWAVFDGDDLAALPAFTCGNPWRQYWSQFAVRLASNQLIRSAVYQVILFAGPAVKPAAVPIIP